MDEQWYCMIGGRQYGPVDFGRLKEWAAQSRISPSDMVWSDLDQAWKTAGQISGLFGSMAVEPPLPQFRSRLAAGLLAVLVGWLGVHNFYLGNTGKGLAQLLITTLTCGVGWPISFIWSLVEGIMILTNSINVDSQGRPLAP